MPTSLYQSPSKTHDARARARILVASFVRAAMKINCGTRNGRVPFNYTASLLRLPRLVGYPARTYRVEGTNR